jgi:alkanesulfonate monooxygenase SsuD/methylene tetrahydromethanopterin reductase-like flavin-dependent oxidoreductase (luciferase family)
VKVDTGVMAPSLSDIGPRARELEALGYDGLLTAETGHDAFLPIALAAEHTERIELATGIAVAFARTPMVLAYTATPADVEGPLRARLGLADQAAHREAVLDAVVAPGPAYARVHPRVAVDLGCVERPDATRFRR